jgi:transposase
MILWDEYRAVHPDGYAYSRFCQLFREFERRLSPTMRQQHVAGHKLFVDYSGKRVPIADPLTGEVRMAEIFVAVLGASSCTYAEATWTQTLPDWIGAHVRMFRFYGAAPRLLVYDYVPGHIIGIGLSRYAAVLGTIVPVRIGFISEYMPLSLVTSPRKEGQGSALDPPKAEDLWKPFIFPFR